MMYLTIPGKPIAKKRPRFARRGKFVNTYSCQREEEKSFKTVAKTQIKGEPAEGAVEVSLIFVMPIPKSTSKNKRFRMLTGKICHTKKPDLDNLEKFALDCLNGIAWKDDSQIIGLTSGKYYGEEPQTIITISEIIND